jgi:hypothetical protein
VSVDERAQQADPVTAAVTGCCRGAVNRPLLILFHHHLLLPLRLVVVFLIAMAVVVVVFRN